MEQMIKANSIDQFQAFVRSLEFSAEHIIVKPNWVNNLAGQFTDAGMLAALLACFRPEQKIIVLESYTPWRGLFSPEIDADTDSGVDLVSGKKHWDFYRRQDAQFLRETGLEQELSLNLLKTGPILYFACCSNIYFSHSAF